MGIYWSDIQHFYMLLLFTLPQHLRYIFRQGRINLVGAKIFAQPGGMHGYRYVINIITETRSFHLCATQRIVYEEWLLKLRSHIDNSVSGYLTLLRRRVT